MREIVFELQFKKDIKKLAKSGRHSKQDYLKVIELLVHDLELPNSYRDHALVVGNNYSL